MQLAVAPPAGAAPIVASTITSTWSGMSTTTNNWSDSGNWSTANGDSVPTDNSSISTLTFPVLPTCDDGSAPANSACYGPSNNDLNNLTVGTLDMTTTPTSPYEIDGNAFNISSGINITGDDSTDYPAITTMPLTLSGTTSAWSVPGSSLDVQGDVTGASTQVNATLSSNANLELDGNVQTQQFNVTGGDTTQTGMNAANNGSLALNDPPGGTAVNLNGANSPSASTDGNPVNATDVAVVGGGSVGSLSVTGGDLNLDSFGSPADLATGGTTLDSNSSLDFDLSGSGSTTVTPGTDYSQLTGSVIGSTTGAIDLGGAVLSLNNWNAGNVGCADPTPGTVYTLVQGTSVTNTVSFDYGGGSVAPVPGGSVISIPGCNSGSSDPLRVDYTPTSMTVTALDATTMTETANPASPQVGQADVLTAKITSASGAVPTGTVTFYENYGDTVISGCANKPLDSHGQATCTTTFTQTGDPGLGAVYTPSDGSDFASSGGGPVSFSVQPAAPSTPPPFEVAYQATGGALSSVGAAGSQNWGVGVAAGTSPSIVRLPKGGYEMAFKANGGSLWTVGNAGWTNWNLGVAPGTSPAIVTLPNGGYEVAFQANGGSLWTVGSAGWTNWGVGMAPGTSPSLVRLANGGYQIAFQANGGNLWTIGTSGWRNWNLGMASGTSPSVVPAGSSGFEVAFQANGGSLWTVGSAGWTNWNLGMTPGTSPSLVRLANGGYETAFQANGGNLWTVGNAGWNNWNVGMAPGTSPSAV